MGLGNSSEYFDEILSRVLDDLIARQIVAKIADDFITGANNIDELFSNYTDVLQRLQEYNLCLAADKTIIYPKSLNILGWVWKEGSYKGLDLTKAYPNEYQIFCLFYLL